MILAVAVGCAGGLGAVGRYVLDGAIQDRTRWRSSVWDADRERTRIARDWTGRRTRRVP